MSFVVRRLTSKEFARFNCSYEIRSTLPKFRMPNMFYAQGQRFHRFMTVNNLIEEISKNRNRLYRCRSVGVVFGQGRTFNMHELGDWSTEVRVSLMYLTAPMPFTGLPFTVQLYGFAHWRNGIGAVMYPLRVKALSARLARRVNATMEWVIANHVALVKEGQKADEQEVYTHISPVFNPRMPNAVY